MRSDLKNSKFLKGLNILFLMLVTYVPIVAVGIHLQFLAFENELLRTSSNLEKNKMPYDFPLAIVTGKSPAKIEIRTNSDLEYDPRKRDYSFIIPKNAHLDLSNSRKGEVEVLRTLSGGKQYVKVTAIVREGRKRVSGRYLASERSYKPKLYSQYEPLAALIISAAFGFILNALAWGAWGVGIALYRRSHKITSESCENS